MKDRTVIVTGGTGDIGYGIAEAFATDGCKVAILGRNKEKGIKAEYKLNTFSDAKFYRCDMSDISQIEDTIKNINDDFGTATVLVNAAGIPVRYPIEEITPENWDEFMNTNLRSVFFTSKVFAMAVREKSTGFGRIINISSVRNSAFDRTHLGYSLTKAGIDILTKGFAVEYGPDGITANSIAPGYVMTEMTAHYVKSLDEETQKKMIASFTPSNRPVEISEIASLALYLASEKSGSVSGQVIKIDGGGNNLPGSFY